MSFTEFIQLKLVALLLILLPLLPANFSCTTSKQPEPELPQFPTAQITSISPLAPYSGSEVSFAGSGHSSTGTIASYQWRSSLDGMLSDKADFSTSNLTEGKHKIFFSVRNDKGEWSEEVTGSVTVRSRVPPPQISYFEVNPARIGLKDKATLTWHVENAAAIVITPDIGIVGQDGKYTVTPKISTPYTLTAINEGGSSTGIADLIVVPIENTGLPKINSFYADPGSIKPGSSANLTWNVTNADFVLIDPAVGAFPASGYARVSPKESTRYTITAQNSVGMVVGETRLLVEEQSSAGKSDLVISDIYKIATPLGIRIGYTIENRGASTAPPSNSRLYANGIYRDIDTVNMIAAGAKQERQFKIWNYNPATSLIKVIANADYTISENNTSNNEMMTTFPVSTIYDFKENASQAQWRNDTREVNFGGNENDEEGAVLIQTKAKLEDSTGPGKYLETRPRATYSGWIMGNYKTGLVARPGDYFYGIVGLLEGSDAGNVEFQVYISSEDGIWNIIGQGISDLFDYKLKPMVLSIPPDYYGKRVDFSLRVNNTAGPLQNRAVWTEAKIIR